MWGYVTPIRIGIGFIQNKHLFRSFLGILWHILSYFPRFQQFHQFCHHFSPIYPLILHNLSHFSCRWMDSMIFKAVQLIHHCHRIQQVCQLVLNKTTNYCSIHFCRKHHKKSIATMASYQMIPIVRRSSSKIRVIRKRYGFGCEWSRWNCWCQGKIQFCSSTSKKHNGKNENLIEINGEFLGLHLTDSKSTSTT